MHTGRQWLSMQVLNTPRLRLRPLVDEDAGFILNLVNDADWLRFIGDKGVHNLADARRYIHQGPHAMYQHQLGLLLVEGRTDAQALGLCGLLQRDYLPMADLGFAYLPEARGQGIGYEAAQAVLAHAFNQQGHSAVAALTALDNQASIGLLSKLGFTMLGERTFSGQAQPSKLFELTKTAWAELSPA